MCGENSLASGMMGVALILVGCLVAINLANYQIILINGFLILHQVAMQQLMRQVGQILDHGILLAQKQVSQVIQQQAIGLHLLMFITNLVI